MNIQVQKKTEIKKQLKLIKKVIKAAKTVRDLEPYEIGVVEGMEFVVKKLTKG